MAVHLSKHMLHLLLVAILIASTKTQTTSKRHCPSKTKCGDVTIPFPFGTTQDCSLNSSFLITCNTTLSQNTPFLNNNNNNNNNDPVRVLGVSLDGGLNISLPLTSVCVNKNDKLISNSNDIDLTPFQLSSTRNRVTVIGADTGGVIYFERNQSRSSCVSLTNSAEGPTSSSSGIYFCQTEIRPKLSDFSNNSVANANVINTCDYGFLVDDKYFRQLSNYAIANHINIITNSSTKFPVVVDWAVGPHNCEVAKKNVYSYACESHGPYQSVCRDVEGGNGYRCYCPSGFYGNPYVKDGCKDVDECVGNSHDCCEEATCINSDGSYSCSCPEGCEGDGKKHGTRCNRKVCPSGYEADGKKKGICTRKDKSDLIIVITLSVSATSLTLLGATFYVYYTLKTRKFIKLKAHFLQQNGGVFLQQQMAKYNGSTKMTKVFTIEELKEATNNFNKGKIIGQRRQGTVYKGVFPNNKIVAIKKSKINNSNQVEHFINEVIMLSQINHRNVVKLLGCCLETEVPLLVYEFIPNGTVYEHLHDQSKSLRFTWETRLRIATETAQALAYLHSATSTPIIHREVKTANILLDHNLVAKVADFGASRTIPLDQIQVTTLVQGTLGYLDPEYFRTSQLTEKSDVYSFGVVLIELVTGKKALCFDGPEDHRNLAMCFDSSMKEGQLVNIVDRHIIDEASIEQLMKVANIASHCLRLKGEERPAMREVAMQLEGICGVDKHQWENTNLSSAETEEVLDPTPYAADIAGGDGGRGNTSSSFDILSQISMSLNNGR